MIIDNRERIESFTSKGWWGEKTIADVFDEAVAERGDELALVDPINRPDVDGRSPRRLTWEELDRQVNRLTRVLADHGIGKDDVFTVQLPNVVELPMMYLAAARLGAVVSPLPIQYRQHELREQIPYSDSSLHITVDRVEKREYASAVAEIREELGDVEDILVLGDEAPEGTTALGPLLAEADPAQPVEADEVTANDILTICWTSGTEGQPKGVPRSHNHWFISAYATVDSAKLTEDDVVLNPFPMVNMAALGGMLVPWLLTKSRLVMHQPFELMAFLKQIAVEQVSYTVAPPALLNMLLKKGELLGRADLDSLRIIGSGSAPLSPWMVETWQEDYGIYVINLFGSNEGCTLVSSPADIESPTKRAKFFPRFGVEGFEWNNRVADCMKTRLVDLETGEEITEPGQPGELRLWGASIFPGYWKAPQMTDRAFDDEGYFRTGDVFEIAGEGDNERFYRFVDRAKDIVIRGGMNISASEVEGLIQDHEAVAEVAILAVPDDEMGERACAAVVPVEGEELTLDDIVDHLRAKEIASYKLPEKFMLADELPRNPVGKIQKDELLETFQN
ncbi:MAG: class I adenylate-forming enzyme family protein [Persicimonas sp.]